MASVEFNDVMKALRIAKSQGDNDKALRLARLANSMMKDEPKNVGSFRSVMGQINKEIAEGVGGLVDFINPFDKYTGSAEQGLKNLMESSNISVADREAEGLRESAGAGLGRAAAAVVPIAKGVQALQGVGGLTGRVAQSVFPSIASTGGVGAELLAGAGAGAAQEEARRRGYGDTVQGIAGVAGGLGAGLAPATARGAGSLAANSIAGRFLKGGTDKIKSTLAPYTEAGAMPLASERAQTGVGGRAEAERIADTELTPSLLNLTPAAKSGNEFLARLERGAMDRDAALKSRIEERRLQADDAARAELTPEGNVSDTQSFVTERIKSFTNTMNGFIKSAQNNAVARISNEGADEASVILANELSAAKNAARAKRNELWDEIDKDQVIPAPQSSAAVLSQKKTLGAFSEKDVPQAINQFRTKYAKKSKDIKVRDLLDLYSKLRATARDASSGENPNSNMARLANEIAPIILKDLDDVDASTLLGKQIADARDFTKIYHDKFSRGTVGQIMAKKSSGDPKIRDELTLEKSLDRGSRTERELAARDLSDALEGRSDEGIGAIATFLRSRFDDEAFPNNQYNQANAQRFLDKYSRVLSDDSFGSVRADIDNAIKSQQKVANVTEKATAAQTAANTEKGNTLLKFASVNPNTAIDQILSSANPKAAMASLLKTAKKDATGQALAGIKSALSQRILDRSISRLDVVRGIDTATSEVRGTKVAEILRNKDFMSIARQVYSNAELNRLKVLSRELQKLDITRVGSDAGIDPFPTNKLVEIIGRILGARYGASLGGNTAGGGLQGAQIVSGRVRDYLARLTTNKAEQLLMRAVEDEELMRTLLLNATQPKNFARIERSLAPYLVGTAAGLEEQ
jgi:hypothetical protein